MSSSNAPSPTGSYTSASRSELRLSIILGLDDLWHHKPKYQEIVRRARDAGLGGASVWRGVEGYGASSHIHTTRLLDLADGLPVLVVILDDPPRIRAFVQAIAELLTQATVTLEDVERIHVTEDRA
jgi:PII-like signaling protein